VSTQVQNSSKTSDEDKTSSWHHQNNVSGSKMSNYQTGSSLVNSDGMNFNAMTKKRKAMHQANSSNRNSADENSSK
jgi:hypothetical protein